MTATGRRVTCAPRTENQLRAPRHRSRLLCLWWRYFDILSLAAEHRLLEARGQGGRLSRKNVFQKLTAYSNAAHQRGVIGRTLRRTAELLGIVGDDLEQLVPALARHFRRLIPPRTCVLAQGNRCAYGCTATAPAWKIRPRRRVGRVRSRCRRGPQAGSASRQDR